MVKKSTSDKDTENKKKIKSKFQVGQEIKSAGKYFIYHIILFAATIYIWLTIIERYATVRNYKYLYIISFIAIVILGSSIIGFFFVKTVNYLKHPIRAKKKADSVLPSRLKVIFLHVMIPLVISLFVALLPITSNETILTKTIRYYKYRNEYPFINLIEKTILSSEDNNTKASGVSTLKYIGSPKTLLSILKILEENHESLEDWDFHSAMEKAILENQTEVVSPLLKCFKRQENMAKVYTKEPGNMHKKYFEKKFNLLKKQTKDSVVDDSKKSKILSKLDEIELNLKKNLRDIEISNPELVDKTTLFDFILVSLLKMNKLKDNIILYNFARKIAEDRSHKETTRGNAISLMAKLGNKNEFDTILPYLKSESETIKKSALSAIGLLHNKIKGKKRSEEDEKKF